MRRPTYRDREIAEERARKAAEEKKNRAAEATESRSDERGRRNSVDRRLLPPPPPPSRSSGFVSTKCSSLPSSSAGEPLAPRGSKPAVLDSDDRPLSSRLAVHHSEKKNDGGKGKDGTIHHRPADHKRKEIAKDGCSHSLDDKGAKKQKQDKRQVTPEPTLGVTQLTTPLTPGALYDNAEASASFFAQVLHKDDRMYIPSSLTKSKAYSEMTLKGAKFFAAINRMVVEYDKSAQEDQARIGEAKTLAKGTEDLFIAEKKETSKVIEDLRAELEMAKSKRVDVEHRNEVLESAKIKNEAKIAELTRSLRAANELLESQVSRAVIEAKQEVEQMFQDRIALAMTKIKLLNGEAKEDMLDLACIEANVQLIEVFTGEAPPSFAEERKKMDSRLIRFGGAYERFGEVISGIQAELTIPPLKKDLFTEIHDNETVELSAARAGIQNLSGSNFDVVVSSLLGSASDARISDRSGSPASALPIDASARIAGALVVPFIVQETGGVGATEVAHGSAEIILPYKENGVPGMSGSAPHPDSAAKKIEAIEELVEKSDAEALGDGGTA